jgi:predicted DNA-binding protein (UPF0251 family)
MPRPIKCRRIFFEPGVTYFKPVGIRLVDLKEVKLTVDEFEAIRLKDLENLEQKDAAKKMRISQPTFHRLLESARKKIAEALVNGKALRIEGGVYEMVSYEKKKPPMKKFMCYEPGCNYEWEVPYGAGRPSSCPKCGSVNIHRAPEDRGYARRGGGGRGPPWK